jgi:hypothetical protein
VETEVADPVERSGHRADPRPGPAPVRLAQHRHREGEVAFDNRGRVRARPAQRLAHARVDREAPDRLERLEQALRRGPVLLGRGGGADGVLEGECGHA